MFIFVPGISIWHINMQSSPMCPIIMILSKRQYWCFALDHNNGTHGWRLQSMMRMPGLFVDDAFDGDDDDDDGHDDDNGNDERGLGGVWQSQSRMIAQSVFLQLLSLSLSGGKRSKQRSLFQSTSIFQTINQSLSLFHFVWFSFKLIFLILREI